MKNPSKIFLQKITIDGKNIAKLESLQQSQDVSPTVNLLLECLHCEDSLKQASLLKKISCSISELDGTSFTTCIHVLAQVFVVFEFKNPAKRALSRLFDKLPDSLHGKSLETLRLEVLNKLDNFQNNLILADFDLRPAIDLVSSLMENFKMGSQVINHSGLQVLGCLSTFLKHLVQKARSVLNPLDQTLVMTNCQAATKAIIAVVQKTCKQTNDLSPWGSVLETIATNLVEILSNDFLPDCQTTSGMALCLIVCLFSSQDQCHQVVLETFFPHYLSRQQIIEDNSVNHTWISRVLFQQKWQAPLSFSHLCLCHGIITMVPLEELIKPLQNTKAGKSQTLLFDVLLSDLFLLCESLKEPFSCLTAFRTLTLWAEQARNTVLLGIAPSALVTQVLGSAPIPQKLLSLVWNNWDHPIEVIRYQTKAIFDHIVNMHVAASGSDVSEDRFLKDLSGKLLQMGWHSRGIYGPLCCLTSATGAKCLLNWHPRIPEQLMGVLKDCITAPHVIDFVDIIAAKHQKEILSAGEDMRLWLKTWVLPVINLLRHQGSIQEGVHVERTLSKLLQCYPESLQFIVKNLQSHYNQNIGILITCLKTARSLGLVRVNDNDSKETWGGVVPFAWLEKALCHIEDQTRLDALGLLCDCPRTTEPISKTDLLLLKVFLPLNMNNQSPSFRQQCGTHLKKLLMRMKESLRISAKHLQRLKDDELHANRLRTYKEFLQWFCNLMFASLFPGSSFSRRTTALHFLKLASTIFMNELNGSICEPFVLNDVITTAKISVLVDCLHDSYDINKVLAYELLKSCPDKTLPFQTIKTLQVWIQEIDKLLSSPRAVDSTTASVKLKILIEKCSLGLYFHTSTYSENDRAQVEVIGGVEFQVYQVLCHLLGKLKAQREVAEQSLNKAACQAPMHGTIYCLREALGHHPIRNFSIKELLWQKLFSNLLDECLQVASLVSPVVTSTSPEGHMIDDDYSNMKVEGEEEVFNPSSQVLLVCCWRTMKEVALLLGDLVQSVPMKTDDTTIVGLLKPEQVVVVGEFFTTVLLTSKHHGAFELAYNGFVKLCRTLWTCYDSSLRSLPLHWLESLLSDIAGCIPSGVLCATRRSAGVPFFVQAIVTTEPISSGKATFKRLMNQLIDIASQPINLCQEKDSTLPQVHARNILRSLYRNTQLGEGVFAFVGDGVKVAITGFLSESWAVQNSSTLLFSALVTRIFGVKKSKDEHSRRNCMTGREFFSRFPELHTFLVDQLIQSTKTIDRPSALNLHPSLYPTLLLLSRLYPSTLDGADSTLSMAAFLPFVIKCGSSSVLKTRSMAARAIVPLVSGESVVQTMKELVQSLPVSPLDVNQNKMHGTLLQIQHLIKSHLVQSTATDMVKGMVASEVVPLLESIEWISSRCNDCAVTRAIFLDIILDLIAHSHLKLKDQNTEIENSSNESILIRLHKVAAQTSLAELSFDCPKPPVSIGQSLLKEVCARIVLTSPTHQLSKEGNKTTPGLSLHYSDDVSFDNSEESQYSSMDHCSALCYLLASKEYEVRLVALQRLNANLPHSVPELSCEVGDKPNSGEIIANFSNEDLTQIASTLLEMGIDSEKHLESLEQVYHALSLVVNCLTFPHVSSSGKQLSLMECWHHLLMKACGSSEQQDGIICSLLDLLSKMAKRVYDSCSIMNGDDKAAAHSSFLDSMHHFSSILKSTSKDDTSFEVRLKTAETLSSPSLSSLLWDPCSLLGGVPLELWNVVVNLLHDDDADVRDCAARVVVTVHNDNPIDYSFSTPTLVSRYIFQTVYTHYYLKEPQATLQWMLDWIVPCDTAENTDNQTSTSLDYIQSEIDLIFERNSLNSYHERVVIARSAFHCLVDAICKTKNGVKDAIVLLPSDNINNTISGQKIGEPLMNETAGNLINGATYWNSEKMDSLAIKCINRLHEILEGKSVTIAEHFYEIFSNFLGLVIIGRLMPNAKINTIATRKQVEESLSFQKLSIEQEQACSRNESLSKVIKELLLSSNIQLISLRCHPVMEDCLRDACETYGFLEYANL